jgi:hypothetical protein
VFWAHDIAVEVIHELLARYSAEHLASMRSDLIPDMSEKMCQAPIPSQTPG